MAVKVLGNHYGKHNSDNFVSTGFGSYLYNIILSSKNEIVSLKTIKVLERNWNRAWCLEHVFLEKKNLNEGLLFTFDLLFKGAVIHITKTFQTCHLWMMNRNINFCYGNTKCCKDVISQIETIFTPRNTWHNLKYQTHFEKTCFTQVRKTSFRN